MAPEFCGAEILHRVEEGVESFRPTRSREARAFDLFRLESLAGIPPLREPTRSQERTRKKKRRLAPVGMTPAVEGRSVRLSTGEGAELFWWRMGFTLVDSLRQLFAV